MRLTIRVLTIGVACAALVGTIPAFVQAEDPPKPPAAEPSISPQESVIRLFDGKTLGDCYVWLKDTQREDPRKVFSVTDGMIHVSGDGLGGLVTNKRYR